MTPDQIQAGSIGTEVRATPSEMGRIGLEVVRLELASGCQS